MVESDAQVVISALQNPVTCPWSIQKVIEGSLLNLSCFKVWSAAHVNRKGNVAAHMMARMAKSVED